MSSEKFLVSRDGLIDSWLDEPFFVRANGGIVHDLLTHQVSHSSDNRETYKNYGENALLIIIN